MISFDHNDPSSAYGACPRFTTLLQALVHQTQTKPQALGLADKARGLTFAQWALRIVATAHELKPELEAMGVKLGANTKDAQPQPLQLPPGAAVLLPAIPSVDYLCLYYALCLCHVIVVPCDKNSTEDTLRYYAEQSGAQVILNYPDAQLSAAGLAVLECTELLAQADRQLSTWEISGQATSVIAQMTIPHPEEFESIYFTSGTTGKSKAVLLTHANTLQGGLNSVSTCAKFSSDIEILTTPIFHAQAASSFRANLILGAASVLFPSFYRPEELQALITHYQCNAINLVPATLKLLLESLGEQGFCDLLAPLRLIEVGTAPTDPTSKSRYSALLPHTWFLYNYGATECSRTVFNLVCGDYLDHERTAPEGFAYGQNHKGQCFATRAELSALGRPVPVCHALVLDDAGKALPTGTPGRLVFEGGMVMQSYLNNPELTASTIAPNRYYSSDCGYFDEYGFIHILGRIDDVINMGGEKISPQEIEDTVLSVPEIKECCCIGGEDALLGVIPVLYYTLNPGAELTESALKQALRSKLNRIHRPKIYIEQKSLPKNRVGKVDRNALKQMWRESPIYRTMKASQA